jgi:hypothetical protein
MNIREFPLAWRWTQSSHSVLPSEVLDQLRPLNLTEAARAHTIAVAQRPSGISYSTTDPDPAEARMWLRRVQPDLAVLVYVSWDQDSAIETTWSIFTQYWDDFCYPSSDDVTVIPIAGAWRLDYYHYEQFEFSASP